jgi:hypothetical protein
MITFINFSRASVSLLKQDLKRLTHRLVNVEVPPAITSFEYKNKIGDHNYWMDVNDQNCMLISPFGHINDVLAVRESWIMNGGRYIYAADLQSPHESFLPAKTMPEEAVRFYLKIVDVTIKRLHALTQSEMIAEGIYHTKNGWQPGGMESAREAYILRWQNEKQNPKFSTNPFLWQYRFVPHVES